jgi:hypothetical protein
MHERVEHVWACLGVSSRITYLIGFFAVLPNCPCDTGSQA